MKFLEILINETEPHFDFDTQWICVNGFAIDLECWKVYVMESFAICMFSWNIHTYMHIYIYDEEFDILYQVEHTRKS